MESIHRPANERHSNGKPSIQTTIQGAHLFITIYNRNLQGSSRFAAARVEQHARSSATKGHKMPLLE